MPSRLLNITEASEYTGFTVHELRHWVKARTITFIKGHGRNSTVYFKPEDLDAFIEAHTVKAEARESR